jgi:F0F1-type ATP synthase beta subunit
MGLERMQVGLLARQVVRVRFARGLGCGGGFRRRQAVDLARAGEDVFLAVFDFHPAHVQDVQRAGRTEVGSITGFYTVLVEGDDFNEPIPDAVKGITDGHLWLSRALATRGHFPALDVLQSISRVRGDVVDGDQVRCAVRVLSLLATYEKIEDLVNIGAYVPGANLEYDLAVQARPKILQYLQQGQAETSTLDFARRNLVELTSWIDQMDKAIKAQAKVPKRPGAAA